MPHVFFQAGCGPEVEGHALNGYEASAEDNVKIRDVIEGIDTAVVVEDYPHYPKSRCRPVLRRDGHGLPIHVVRGIPSGQ